MRTRTLSSLLLSVFVHASMASEFIATNVYVVGKDAVVSDEQWVLAGIAETEGTFRNDLFIATGNPLNLNGIFEGNVWAAASTEANFNGSSERNVRMSGKAIVVNGSIGGNLMAVGDTIIIGTNGIVAGNARLIGTSVILEGIVKGNANVSAARIATIDGKVGGDATVVSPDILLPSDARIGGTLNYMAGKEIIPDEGVVAGELKRMESKTKPLFSTAKLMSKAMWFLAAMLVGIPFITLFPMTTAMASHLIKNAPLKCLLVGILASGALPIFGIIAVSSVVGVPLGALILASWGILFYLSRIVLGLVIGTVVLRGTGTSIGKVVLAMAIGLATIYACSLVPAIGVPVQITVLWLGMGSLIIALLEKRKLILQVPQNLKKLDELRNDKNNSEEKTP